MRKLAILLLAGLAAGLTAAVQASPIESAPAPAVKAAADLLAADRMFGESGAKKSLVEGISAMFDQAVVMPTPSALFANGKAAAIEALRADPANAAARATWMPLRAGISADGRHGFTFGFMTITEEGKPDRLAKYLSYWVKRSEGWRVAVYKRMGRPEGDVPLAVMEPSLPTGALSDPGDHRQSLMAAERAFAAEAQTIGIGPAFRKYGRADAANMGSGPDYTIGAEAIARDVSPDDAPGSPVDWGPDDALVAASGDLGITWGRIRPKPLPGEAEPAAIPFTTVWRRDGPDAPWRYIAE